MLTFLLYSSFPGNRLTEELVGADSAESDAAVRWLLFERIAPLLVIKVNLTLEYTR